MPSKGDRMFNTIQEIIDDITQGRMVVVVDDEERENEGDLVMAASFAKPADINFMATYGRGLICVPMEEARCRQLDLAPMAAEKSPYGKKDPYATAWVMSVDAAHGVTTGISAFDRARTIAILIDGNTQPEDLVRPGHVFPLRAVKGGVLVRAGHTEAAVDLARLAKLPPAGVICEIMNEDGTMARLPQLREFAKKHGLKICSIKDLIEYRRRSEKLIERVSEATLPTESGTFKIVLYRDSIAGREHTALVMGEITDEPVLVRVHSACLTGDVFGSLRCDCGNQLKKAMQTIAAAKRGIVLYMSQEGRGIGLADKIKAYRLQEQGMDTVEANEALGYRPDLRDYGIGAQILEDLGVRRIRLMTNNPRKIVGLEGYGLKVVERVALEVAPHAGNYKYLKTKKEKLGHNLTL